MSPITRETILALQQLQEELGMFHGLRNIWAQGVANHRALPLSLEEMMKEQLKHLHFLAFHALEAYQSVFPGRSPHQRFAYASDPKKDAGARVVEDIPRLPDVAGLTRQVAERVMGWRWHASHPEPALSGGEVSGPVYEMPEVRANPFHSPGEVYRPASSFQPINALGSGDDEATARSCTLEIVERMSRGHRFWCQVQTPFTMGDLYWAGFTPLGTNGRSGRPDHWTGTPNLGFSVCLAALAAVTEKERTTGGLQND